MNEQTIFIAALQQLPNERKAFLHGACADDPQLRRRIERLLAAHENAAGFMAQPAGTLAAALDEPISEQPGTQIGRY